MAGHNLRNAPLDEVIKALGGEPHSSSHQEAAAELQRRKIESEADVLKALQESAEAATQSARWMKWSVVAIAITSGVTAFMSIVTFFATRPS